MKVRFLLPILFLLGSLIPAGAQDKVQANLGVDLVSSYVWRGQYLGKVALQPTLAVGWKGLELSAWGSAGLADSLGEIDLTLSYQIGGLKLSVIDYWDTTSGVRYFYYKPKDTGHAFEGVVAYDFGPVIVSWQTFFAGGDYQEADGRRAFSSYFEVSAPFRLGTLEWMASAGFVPWASDLYDTKGFSLNCLSLKATKNFSITEKFTLPVFAQLMANPTKGNFYFVAGISIGI